MLNTTDEITQMAAALRERFVPKDARKEVHPPGFVWQWEGGKRGDPVDGLEGTFAREIHEPDANGVPNIMPDNYRFDFAVEALDAIGKGPNVPVEEPDVDEADEWATTGGLHRTWYVNEFTTKAQGMMQEKMEVYAAVLSFLRFADADEILNRREGDDNDGESAEPQEAGAR